MRSKVKQAQMKRDEYENAHLGKYHKVFPIEDEEKMATYEKLIEHADKSYFSDNNVLRAQIE